MSTFSWQWSSSAALNRCPSFWTKLFRPLKEVPVISYSKLASFLLQTCPTDNLFFQSGSYIVPVSHSLNTCRPRTPKLMETRSYDATVHTTSMFLKNSLKKATRFYLQLNCSVLWISGVENCTAWHLIKYSEQNWSMAWSPLMLILKLNHQNHKKMVNIQWKNRKNGRNVNHLASAGSLSPGSSHSWACFSYLQALKATAYEQIASFHMSELAFLT